MKRQSLAILAAVILLLSTVMTGACAESILPELVDAGAALLLDTDNVTIRAEADLALNGKLFKHFSGTQIQVGNDAYRDVRLITPQADGLEKETGYLYLVNGSTKVSYDRHQKRAEVYQGVTYRNTILRRSVEADNLAALCRSMAAYAASSLPADAAVQQGDTWTIKLDRGSDLSSIDTVLTLLLQRFGAYRSYVDYRQIMPSEYAADIWDYSTVTEGILFCTTCVQLEQLTMTVRMDPEGRLTGIEGNAGLTLMTRNGTEQSLTVDFQAEITDYGMSILPENPVPEEEMLAAQDENILMYLTEVYGYSREEAEAFVMDVDGAVITCHPAAHPEWRYEWLGWTLQTPFSSDFDYYPGEGSLRGFLEVARNNGWLKAPSARNKTILQGWLGNFNIVPDMELEAMLEYDAEWTPEQFIGALFRSCYGPEEGWPANLDQWRDEEIAWWDAAAAAPEDESLSADTVVYYNPNGGNKYHADVNCPSVSEKYLPLAGSCSLEELAAGELAGLLLPCNFCGAAFMK